MLGPMEMLPKGEFHNGHNVIAFIGSYDEATHTFTKENVQLMDGGIDFYACLLYTSRGAFIWAMASSLFFQRLAR